jgi:protein disulfide-isomerase A6
VSRFYAPWCGHCQNLKPAYEKAAKNLQGLAKVAAINCDDDYNKAFCGSMGVQGFPTLKIIQPTKKSGKPRVEDYQGARSAKAIVEAVVEKIPNHVKRVQDKGLEEWLAEKNETAKAILFTDKGTTSALLRALAVDFLDGISIAQIRNEERVAVEMFGITKFPTFVLLPGGDKRAILYDGEMKKASMVEFLSQVTSPNPDPAPQKAKSSKKAGKDDKKKSSKNSNSFSSASSSHKSADASEAAASGTSAVIDDTGVPTESLDPKAALKDAPTAGAIPDAPVPISTLATPEELQESCLRPETTTCVLALLPALPEPDAALPESATLAITSLSQLADKHAKRKGKLFPFYAVPALNTGAAHIRTGLGLKDESSLEIVAINGRRGWWKHYEKENYGRLEIEGWIDSIRLGEGSKQKLPDGILTVDEQVHDEL